MISCLDCPASRISCLDYRYAILVRTMPQSIVSITFSLASDSPAPPSPPAPPFSCPQRLQRRHVPADHAEQHRARPGVLALRVDRLEKAFVVEPAPDVAAARAVCRELLNSSRAALLYRNKCLSLISSHLSPKCQMGGQS